MITLHLTYFPAEINYFHAYRSEMKINALNSTLLQSVLLSFSVDVWLPDLKCINLF